MCLTSPPTCWFFFFSGSKTGGKKSRRYFWRTAQVFVKSRASVSVPAPPTLTAQLHLILRWQSYQYWRKAPGWSIPSGKGKEMMCRLVEFREFSQAYFFFFPPFFFYRVYYRSTRDSKIRGSVGNKNNVMDRCGPTIIKMSLSARVVLPLCKWGDNIRVSNCLYFKGIDPVHCKWTVLLQ